MKRDATAQWTGDLKTGRGTISLASGTLKEAPYSFHARFEDGQGTNPEELVAAAHAGCFTMALAAELGKAKLVPSRLRTTATVSLDPDGGGWRVGASHLDVVASIPGATQDAFLACAKTAETNCPISKLLNAKITMDAKLEGAD